MSRKANPTNLRDMVSFITDIGLQQRLIRAHAPGLKINWSQMPTKNDERATLIVARMAAFAETGEDEQGQVASLLANLNTISLINSDDGNKAVILNEIRSLEHSKLNHCFINWPHSLKQGVSNLATFVNIIANCRNDPEATEDEKAAVDDARTIWKDLVLSAGNLLKDIAHCPFVSFEPTQYDEEKIRDGIRDFEKEFKATVGSKYLEGDFFAFTMKYKVNEYVRYIVTTAPLSHQVAVVNKDRKRDADGNLIAETATRTERDTHVKTFEIIHDPFHHRLCCSKTPLLAAKDIILMFAQCVFGSKPIKKECLSYAKSIQFMKSPECMEKIKLPSANVKRKDGVWISSIEILPDKDRMPVVFHGDETTSVFDEIKRVLSEESFPIKKRIVKSVLVRLRLHQTMTESDSKTVRALSAEKAYSVRISENGFTINGENRNFDPEHQKLLSSLKDLWGIEGLKRDQAILGKGNVTTEGNLFS